MIGVAGVVERTFHVPVMVAEVLKLMAPRVGGTYLDGTVGGGGHADRILAAAEGSRVLAVDRDPEAVQAARKQLRRFGDRVRVEVSDFAEACAKFDLGEGTLDGVLLDLGVSSHQIDSTSRGFTFRPGAPLDMRMGGEGHGGQSAADLLHKATEGELRDIFRQYGEERRAGRLARTIAARRSRKRLRTSDDLVAAIDAAFGRATTPAEKARIFQALRIAVNEELGALDAALPTLRGSLRSGGRFLVLSYHSLEDRRVKRAFRSWSRDCVCPPEIPICQCGGVPQGRELVRRPVRPSEEEIARNPRARSARLRAWEKA